MVVMEVHWNCSNIQDGHVVEMEIVTYVINGGFFGGKQYTLGRTSDACKQISNGMILDSTDSGTIFHQQLISANTQWHEIGLYFQFKYWGALQNAK